MSFCAEAWRPGFPIEGRAGGSALGPGTTASVALSGKRLLCCTMTDDMVGNDNRSRLTRAPRHPS